MLRKILTISGYVAAAAVIILATVSLVAYGQGYAYDFKTGRIIRTGLVIIQSVPSGATVSLNGKVTKKKTPYRQSFEQGRYEFGIQKDGFHPWKKVFNVVASEVALVQYALLVPLKPEVKNLDTKPNVTAQAISRDHRRLAYVVDGPDSAVYVMDMNGGKPVKVYSPKAATAEDAAESLTEVLWSEDGSRLLVTAKQGEAARHYLMNADGGQQVSLTDQYRFDFTGLRFSTNNSRILYWISPDGLRRLDTESQSVSGVLAEKVRQFEIAGDRVLYVHKSDLGESLWSLNGRGDKQELIPALPESDTYALAFASYRGQEQLAVVPSRTKVGTLYSDIYGTNPVAKTVAHDVTKTSFSPDGHVLAFYDEDTLTSYDLERAALTHLNVTYQFAGISSLTKLTWFDNFHLLLTMRDEVYLTEFDGANSLNLGTVVGSLPAYSTDDLRSITLFRPGTSAGGPVVTIDDMIVRP